MSIILFVSL